jgi:hypothetical protein
VHGEFANHINDAINARSGFAPVSASRESAGLTPLTDVPLFGLVLSNPPSDGDSTIEASPPCVSHVLPERKHADQLVNLYWQYLQSLEPFLEKESFSRAYDAVFAGKSLGPVDQRIFLCILNTVFALSTQLQESIPLEERERKSTMYFNRAWALLQLESKMLWEPGSIELVQCLLLMGRYLQCTSNMHKAWISVGLAVRVAQSIGIHKPYHAGSPVSSEDIHHNGNYRQQLWDCCIYMDR